MAVIKRPKDDFIKRCYRLASFIIRTIEGPVESADTNITIIITFELK